MLIFREFESGLLTGVLWCLIVAPLMDKENLDRLHREYNRAVETWISAIRAEGTLATSDHSVAALDQWEHAAFYEQDAQSKAKVARDAYKDALREENFNI